MLSAQIAEITGVVRGINYGTNKVRFISKVKVGSRIRLRQKVAECERRACGVRLVSECTIEIEGVEKPACFAETIAVFYDR